MHRQKTLYGRMFWIFFLALTVLFIMIMIFGSYSVRQFCVRNAFDSLYDSGDYMADVYEEAYAAEDAGERLTDVVDAVSSLEGCVIDIFDKYGANWFHKETVTEAINETMLEQNRSALMDAASGYNENYIVSYDTNLYSTPIVSIRLAIFAQKEQKGHILITKRLDNYERIMRIFYKRLILAGAVSLILASVLYLLYYRRIKRNCDMINFAARSFARGDFKTRIKIKSDDDVGRLSETFNTMANEIQKYEDTRQSFVANVSHELRSPLTSVQGFVQAILDGAIDEKDQQKYLEIVLTETKRMSSLIGDLLDLSKIESGQFPMNVTDFDITELLRTILINFMTKIEDKHINVSANIPEDKVIVLADVSRISQVLTNLIDNAVKFCDENGSLKIWTYDSDGRIHINISNSGTVISEDDIPHVFDRFFKADKSHNRKAGGTGIGLSIVINIIQQHGEKIWVNSHPGVGTVFTFTLRIKEGSTTNNG
ncbi:MAG: HAMP domain-containing histidine kinase [Christensenellaceae bacterium]|nr:HAMP domain-containing histidine kinase [Christensenellaceae bacterium]